MGAAGVAFFPLNTLPFLGDVYEAKMLISHDTERQRFEGEIPMAVSGEKPSLPSSAEWQKAYAWLKSIRRPRSSMCAWKSSRPA